MTTLFPNEYEPPTSEPGDGVGLYQVVESFAGLLPTGAALLNHIVMPPLERRRQEWMEEVGQALRRLSESKGVDVEALANTAEFVDAVLQATQAALRTSQALKREALRNTILNCALGDGPEVTLQHIFVGLIDRYTAAHLRLVDIASDTRTALTQAGLEWPVEKTASLHGLIDSVVPELSNRPGLVENMWKELFYSGLLRNTIPDGGGYGGDWTTSWTTDLGDQFLTFIGEPN